MASHPIIINVINNEVGQAASSDGVMMMFVKGVAIGQTLALDTPYLLSKLADATALGITAAADLTNSTVLFQQINEYYNGGLNDGCLLWLVVTAIASNPYATYVTGQTFQSLVRYTAQDDPAQRAKMLGFCYEMPSATQSSGDFPSDVLATITALQAAQVAMFGQGFQWSAILDGYMMSDTVTPESVGTMANKAAAPVSLCITGTKPNGVSGVGLAMGRFARISAGHGFGEVADGPINTDTAYLTNGATIYPSGALVVGKSYTVLGGAITYNSNVLAIGTTFMAITSHTTYTTAAGGYVVTGATPVKALSPGNSDETGDIDYLGKKQYMFLRTWFNQSGFFWNDAATCTLPTLQISSQEFNRVANSLSASALSFNILQMNKNLPLDSKTGNVSSAYLNALNADFYTEYIEPMITSGDISDGAIVFTGPNFNALRALNFTLSINGQPIVSSINGTVQFVSSLAA